jgi:hypothetical protein
MYHKISLKSTVFILNVYQLDVTLIKYKNKRHSPVTAFQKGVFYSPHKNQNQIHVTSANVILLFLDFNLCSNDVGNGTWADGHNRQ